MVITLEASRMAAAAAAGSSAAPRAMAEARCFASSARKFLNQVQTAYPRKNWSSLMLFNNERCRALSADYVNGATGLELHRFAWVDDALIGSLPLEWNWLVDEYDYRPDAKIVHFTRGGPWFPEFERVDYAEEWRAERAAMGAAG